jgi:hypothetical protein
MVSPATSLHELPGWLTPAEAAAVLRLDPYTIRRSLREGVFPGAVKLPDRFWRIPRQSVEAILGGAPAALTDEQRETIRAVFADCIARPRRVDHRPHSRKRRPADTTATSATKTSRTLGRAFRGT